MKALDRLRTLTRLHDLRDRPDAELVRLFADRHDEAAFELLVRRHGPLVLGVCRRALGDATAADDAFQATFLLLARRAPTLRQPAGVANWLYGVAARTAREARRHDRRRRRRERVAARPEAVHPADDTAAAVDAAVRRLPEPYRSAVLLCDLGGCTREQAARELGVPAGTVASRQSRGRVLLAGALTRQGVTLSAGAAVGVPTALFAQTVRLGVLLAAGEAAVPAAVGVLLTHGGRTMLPLGLWKVTAVVLMMGGAAVVLPGGQKPADPPPAAKPADKGPTPAERLARLRAELDAAVTATNREVRDEKTGEVIGVGLDPNVKMFRPGPFLTTLLELGESSDEETAAAALAFAVVRFGAMVPGVATEAEREDANKAYVRLYQRFGQTPRLTVLAVEMESVRSLGHNQKVEALLMFVTDRAVRGRLEFQLAVNDDPQLSINTGEAPDHTDYRRELTAARYRRVAEKYADVDGGKLAQRAERHLAGLSPPKHLMAGKPAPKTVGVDLAGKPMDLAEFRGKVVVLEFWGSWCGPCVAATPGLKWLADTYADKGVVVLGVMAETDPAAARTTAEKLGVPWRNWLDVRTDGRSPIVAAWDVRRFPTTVVIDRAGVIRAVDPGQRAELVKAVDAVLASPPAKP